LETRAKKEILLIFVFFILYAIFIRVLVGEKWAQFIAIMMTYFIPVAGKEILIPLSAYLDISLIATISAIVMIDLMICLVIIYNWWIVDKFVNKYSIAEKYYSKVQNKALKLNGRTKFGMYLFLFFVMVSPIQLGGSLTVALIGKILGMRNRIIIFIVISGSLFVLFIITILTLQLLKIGGIL
jgi:uncharacterized membrane protein